MSSDLLFIIYHLTFISYHLLFIMRQHEPNVRGDLSVDIESQFEPNFLFYPVDD